MIRVGVLRGGTGSHYNESLSSGAFVLANLPKDKYQAIDIFIDREGVWHISGVPVKQDILKTKVDVVWNALHGFYGEDGKLSQMLDQIGVPHTSGSMLSSAILSHKKMAKEHFVNLGYKTPRAIYVEDWGGEDPYLTAQMVTGEVFKKYSPPWKVVPISRMHNTDGVICKTKDELTAYLKKMCELDIACMVEEIILGRNASIVVMPGFRNRADYSLLPMLHDNRNTKLQKNEQEELEKIAQNLHKKMHLGAYSRITVCVNQKGNIFVCGVDTLPDTSEASHLHKSLENVGSSFPEFAEHMIQQALLG